GAAVRDGEGVAAGAVGRLPPLVVGRRRLPEGDGRRPRARGGAGRGVGRRGDADGAVAAHAVRAAEAGSMTVGLVYDRFGDAEPPPGAPPDWDAEYEPERTIAALEGALRHLGHTPVRLGNVPALLTAMQRGPLGLDAAVTIAESYGSRNREAHAPVLLELAGVPTLGSDALTLSASLDKHLTKVVARHAGLATPDWAVVRSPDDLAGLDVPYPVFVKPRYEGTAKGIAPTSRCDGPAALRAEVGRQAALYRQDLLVEAFVEGAEFTVGVVGHDPPEALPALQRAVEATTGIGLHALERHEDPARPFAYDLGIPI